MLAGGVIIPLIVYLTEGKRDEYVRHHASECLNFQITFMAFWFGSFLLFFGTAVVGASTDSPPWPIFFVFPLMFIAMFGAIGLSIYGAVQASRGVRWRYPLRPARRPRLTRIHSYSAFVFDDPGARWTYADDDHREQRFRCSQAQPRYSKNRGCRVGWM